MRRAASRAACTAGKSKRDEHADDGDDDQQLDEREARLFAERRERICLERAGWDMRALLLGRNE